VAENEPSAEQGAESGANPKLPLLLRAREWAFGSKLRSALVAGGLVGLMGVTTSVWLVLASIAAPPPVTTIEDTLKALDSGDLELAKALVTRMQEQQSIATDEYGGPLFVLGAIRSQEAQDQWSPERRRQDYLVAAKYLDEARSLGVPVDREYEALFLLGKAYIGSDQLDQGVDVLTKAVDTSPTHETEIHGLLAQAHYFAPRPNYALALEHLNLMLADPSLASEDRDAATMRKARALSRLGRHAEAAATLAQVSTSANPAEIKLIEGTLLMRTAIAEKGSLLRKQLLVQAEQSLAEAERLDKLATRIAGESQYVRGKIEQLEGDRDAAMKRFAAIRKRFGMSSAGIASSAAEGDLLRAAGDTDDSLDAYRRTLDAVEDTSSYHSELLSIADLRSIMLGAHGGFVAQHSFDAALNLIDHISPLMGEARRLELRAQTQLQWGQWLTEQAYAKSWPPPDLLREGRDRFREAGVSYRQLAEKRFATALYPDDLWLSAEAFFKGQNYTSASELLREYLKNEPQQRNAQALLRLGQSLLALGESREAVEAFEECVEFHPLDAATYGARLAAARAHADLGEVVRAEELLRDNLIGGTLSPRSPEWRDSKFELGSLLHATGRHSDAIDHLEEAIMRYQDDPAARQLRTARYLAAESYRQAAEEPMRRFREAKAVNEREKSEKTFRALLTKSLEHYNTVQREISRSNAASATDRAMLRNCYMLKGSVLFDLERYKEAVDEYSNVSALYQNEPFVLETLVQISSCWRRLGEPGKARGNIDQAKVALERLPASTDFLATTTRSRREWESLLATLASW